MKYGKATSVNSDTRLALFGLLELARQHRAALTDITTAVENIIQEDSGAMGRAGDFVWGEEGSADRLLELEGIKVVDIIKRKRKE